MKIQVKRLRKSDAVTAGEQPAPLARGSDPVTQAYLALPIGLQALARALRAEVLEEANGQCLARSLDLASGCYALGVDARLIHWHVYGDALYQDHWAVAVGETLVLDPTRIQVDGSRHVAHLVSSYPANYSKPSLYQLAQVLPPETSYAPIGRRFSAAFMWTFRWNILKMDMHRAWFDRNGRQAREAVACFFRFAWWYPLQNARKRLESRYQSLR